MLGRPPTDPFGQRRCRPPGDHAESQLQRPDAGFPGFQAFVDAASNRDGTEERVEGVRRLVASAIRFAFPRDARGAILDGRFNVVVGVLEDLTPGPTQRLGHFFSNAKVATSVGD